jgi:Zn-dependent membrane protease YugP
LPKHNLRNGRLNQTAYTASGRHPTNHAYLLASQTAPWLFIAGVMLQLPTLAWVGVILFGASSVFALITLPVEFNASARAQELLISHGTIRGDEQIAGVQKVLGAAAWTYVAAAVSAIGSWLFYVFVLLSQARSDRR